MLEELATQAFWVGLLKIIGVNIILSGDNAVVIALAARSLPAKQQKAAVLWGSGAAVVMRIILTIFAVALLTLPWLKIVGSLLLFWIGVKLLVPEEGGEDVDASENLIAAIKTILIADLVMSIDNVIGVAGAAKGHLGLLVFGLVVSIPLVVVGAQLIMRLVEKMPWLVIAGGGLLGYIAGEMVVTDPVAAARLQQHGVLALAAPFIGLALVVAVGLLARRRTAEAP